MLRSTGGLSSNSRPTAWQSQDHSHRRRVDRFVRWGFRLRKARTDESYDSNLARDLSHCDLVRDLTRRLNNAHEGVDGWTMPPIQELCQILGDEGDNQMTAHRVMSASSDVPETTPSATSRATIACSAVMAMIS